MIIKYPPAYIRIHVLYEIYVIRGINLRIKQIR